MNNDVLYLGNGWAIWTDGYYLLRSGDIQWVGKENRPPECYVTRKRSIDLRRFIEKYEFSYAALSGLWSYGPSQKGADKQENQDLLKGGNWQKNGGNPYSMESPLYRDWERRHHRSVSKIISDIKAGNVKGPGEGNE